jgi:hypothetical protein
MKDLMTLLPLSTAPFEVPTDRDMLPSERRLFVETHRTCVIAYARQKDGPALHRNDQGETITHWLSASVPWAAADEVPGD